MKQEQRIDRLTEGTLNRYRPKGQTAQPQPWRRQRRQGRRYCRLVAEMTKGVLWQ